MTLLVRLEYQISIQGTVYIQHIDEQRDKGMIGGPYVIRILQVGTVRFQNRAVLMLSLIHI